MKKQGKCNILGVSVPEWLSESNEKNERIDLCLDYEHVEDAADEDEDEVAALLNKAVSNNKYHYLLDATRLFGDDVTEKDALKKAKNILNPTEKDGKTVYKQFVFTTYIFTIAELLKGSQWEKYEEDGKVHTIKRVHNEDRAYSSHYTPFLKEYGEESEVFESMRNDLLEQLKNGEIQIGGTDEEEKAFNAWKKAQKAA